MQIRRIAIKTVDGLSPMPVSSGWVRDGLFVIGMDSEFAVYSQWKPTSQDETPDDATEKQKNEVDTVDNRHLEDSDLLNIAQVMSRVSKGFIFQLLFAIIAHELNVTSFTFSRIIT